MIERGLWDSGVELQSFLESCECQLCFIGGIAIQRWGEPRVTDDMNVTGIAGFGNEQPMIQSVVKRYQARIADAFAFVIHSRALLLQDIAGYGIDLSLGALPFEERDVRRSSLWGTSGSGTIRKCIAEDLWCEKRLPAGHRAGLTLKNHHLPEPASESVVKHRRTYTTRGTERRTSDPGALAVTPVEASVEFLVLGSTKHRAPALPTCNSPLPLALCPLAR